MGGGGLKDECGAIRCDDSVGSGRRRGGGNPALFILVSLYVLGQVVAPHEPFRALRAHKLLLSCENTRTAVGANLWLLRGSLFDYIQKNSTSHTAGTFIN